MVGLVLVSHSRALAEAGRELALAMTSPDLPVAVAAGAGEEGRELGTDALAILKAIERADSGDGVVVLMDIGSAVLSAETALDFLDDEKKARVFLCPAPFVEGAVAAAVGIHAGWDVKRVRAEASAALQAKQAHLDGTGAEPGREEGAEARLPGPEAGAVLRVTVPNPLGLHARPAAKLVQEAQSQSRISIANLSKRKGPAPANSLVSLIALEARGQDELEIRAEGPDQDAVLERLKLFVQSGMGDPMPDGKGAGKGGSPVPEKEKEASGPIGISPGFALGPLFRPQRGMAEPPERTVEDAPAESRRLQEALGRAREALQRQAGEVGRRMGKEQGGIFEAQGLVLEDPVLVERAAALIREQRLSAERAWWLAVREAMDTYRRMKDEMLRERAADVEDAGREVLAALGHGSRSFLEVPEPGLLLVEELTPAEVSRLDAEKVRGVICLQGSRTSHSAILLRSRGIPAAAQARKSGLPLETAEPPVLVALNGETGEILVGPDAEAVRRFEKERKAFEEAKARALAESAQPARTRGGERFEVFANVGKAADAEAAARNGADGIGLLRTEFMFLDRAEAPGEEEQYEILCAICGPMQGKPVVVRTLDAGGDKELPYLQRPPEANPYLGVRAIRLCLQDRNLFQAQLRAILRAAEHHDIRVMFPMIATLHEWEEARKELERAHEDLARENIPHRWPLRTGMMMEVPSAALLADTFVPWVDFVSIGTNDLAQYTLAADRGNTALAHLQDPLDPAVLELIRIIVRACRKHGVPAAVCGEAAADPKAARIFAGIGIRELSMSSRLIPAMKKAIRSWD